MRLRTVAAAALVVLATATGAAGQDRAGEPLRLRASDILAGLECTAEGQDCFALWTGCGDLDTFVFVGENTIGVREADVENAVASRLRAAGLYSEDPAAAIGVLLVDVSFTDSLAFNANLEFGKLNLRDRYGFAGIASTWTSGAFGTHGGRASGVMERVRRFLDQFMNDYLRVNAPACAARRGSER